MKNVSLIGIYAFRFIRNTAATLLICCCTSLMGQVLSVGPVYDGRTVICENGNGTFRIQGVNHNGKTPAYYVFSFSSTGLSLHSPVDNVSVGNFNAGNQSVSAYVKYTDSTSSTMLNEYFDVYPPPVARMMILTNDTQAFTGHSFCFLDSSEGNMHPWGGLTGRRAIHWGDGMMDSLDEQTSGCHNYATGNMRYPVYMIARDRNNCTDVAYDTVFVSGTTGMRHAGARISSVTVFPNPSTTGKFIIQSHIRIIHSQVYDITGKLVHSIVSTATAIELNLRDKPDGVYFASLRLEDGSYITQKIVLSR